MINPVFHENDEKLLKHMMNIYGDAMSAKGINLLDPFYSTMFHYNKIMSKGMADVPRVNRTYVFITRPELNFSYENINSVPFFKWLYSKPIGRLCMAALSDPYSFLYAPAGINISDAHTATAYLKIIDDAREKMSAQDKNLNAKAGFTRNGNGNNALSIGDAKNLVEKLNDTEGKKLASIDFSDTSKIENSIDEAYNSSDMKDMNAEYDAFMKTYDDMLRSLNKSQENLNKMGTTIDSIDGSKILLAKDIYKSVYPGFNYTSPFIPILQNTCVNASGAKDFNLESFSYENDYFSGNLQVPTGMDELWGSGTLPLQHDDIMYTPASLIYIIWIYYIHLVSRGYIVASREHIINRILDYTCSVYMFTIGGDGRTIERFAKFTGCYPATYPMGSQIEHNNNVNIEMLRNIGITFNYNRYEPMEPLALMDFNFVSQTEWLFKLNNWDYHYNRNAGLSDKLTQYNSFASKSLVEKNELLKSDRPASIWKLLKKNEIGSSGRVPDELVRGTRLGSDSYRYSDLINNYWGGFPYIRNASELLWVMPEWNMHRKSL